MPYDRPGEEGSEYKTLAHLIDEVVGRPGELFMLARGCEALVYVEELDQILLVSCQGVIGSREVREENLRQKVRQIVEEAKR